MYFLLRTLALSAVGIAPIVLASSSSVSPRQLQQSLSNELSKHADFSDFNQILSSYPSIINNVTAGSDNKITLLVPTNDAFANFLKQSNTNDISQISVDRVLTIFQYHTLDAPLTAMNFSSSRGITVPTKLRDALYNLRSPGPALISQYGDKAQGQVLYISRDTINPAKLRVRQGSSSSDDKVASLRAGLGQTAELTTIDGEWDGGYFQSIDTILEAPRPCSTTIKKLSDSLTSLMGALEKTKLWRTLDAKPNVTCLGPNTQAFDQAGNPEKSLGEEELKGALLFHTLPEVAYSNFLEDGQEFTSLANLTVRVTVKDDEIWFNDAKVVSPNVLTNNGLIHVLDRVMSPNATGPSPPDSPSSTASRTGSSTTNPSSTNAPPSGGNPVTGNIHAAAVIALAAGVLLV
ncbi:fasciclin domain-containing protein [Colletotrichum sublineola]|uniref:Putative fasciclin domain-containing protein n=1 Tax=Colletotrichum sublineola TaxID=1173701 RepID=A0A066X282_COLSU|nr:fasciclin domain-containing protein [Colletotrichum sublineola]KDN60120.1 putative fasciclin domain-containing protein [Colletotrichum sublineola]